MEGEAGIGKNRLLYTWAARAAASSVRVLRARCDELERSLLRQPVVDCLDNALSMLPSMVAPNSTNRAPVNSDRDQR